MIDLEAQDSVGIEFEAYAFSTFFFEEIFSKQIFGYLADGFGIGLNIFLCNKLENRIIERFGKDD